MHIGHQTVIKFCFNKNKNTVNPRRVANEVCVENKPTFFNHSFIFSLSYTILRFIFINSEIRRAPMILFQG